MIKLLAGAAMLAALTLPAFAQGTFPGYPVRPADQITGNETIPADTNDPSGPATVLIPLSAIAGLNATVQPNYSTIPLGGVALASLGTDSTPVAGTIYLSSLSIPVDYTIASISCLNGSVAATNLLIYGLWNPDGSLAGSTALTGVVAAGVNAFQTIPVTAPLTVNAGNYFVGLQTNGATTRFRTVAAGTYINVLSAAPAGVFGTLPTVIPPTGFTAGQAPICYVTGTLAAE